MSRPIQERRKKDIPQRTRWLEIAISVFVSIIASAIAASWTISSALSELRGGFDGHSRMLTDQEARITQTRAMAQGAETVNATQNSQIAVSDARSTDIVRRLDSIETKVDRLVEREPRR